MMASSRPEESPLSSVLDREQRGHLTVLVGSITQNIRDQAALAVNNPQRSRSINWIEKWQEAVIRRVSEAANTRWEPLKTNKPKDWDELSWDESATPKEAEVDTSLHQLYPPLPTPLVTLEKDKRVLVLHSVLLILLSLKHYYAPSRLLLVYLASSLNLPLNLLDRDEGETAATLMSAAKEMSAQEEVDKKAKENQSSRRWKVGLASVAGAAVIGLTGGLAAPLVAAGLGTVLGGLGLGATAAAGLLGSLAGSSVLVGGLFGAYGARMTSDMVDQYAREVSDFKFVPLKEDSGRRLRVTIAISGWLNEEQEVWGPWRVLGDGTEAFCLRWELGTLMNLGSGLKQMVTSAAWNIAKMEILKRTVFASLLGAMMLPLGLIRLGTLVDNPFRVAKSRADKAGVVLADALINRAQGERPVALIGYSLGARVIQSCLLSLQKRQAYGLIDTVILLGAPVPSDAAMWQAMRTVVSGRLVNVYSENDYVLGFLYRANSVQVGIAGLTNVEAVGVENKNVSDIVDGHMRYKVLIGRILNEIGWRDLDSDELMREHEDLKALQEQEAEAMRKAKAKKEKVSEGLEDDDLISDMDKEVSVERPASESPPPMPPRPAGNKSSQLDSLIRSVSISDGDQASARPTQAQVSQQSASKQQQQTLIDLTSDTSQSAPSSKSTASPPQEDPLAHFTYVKYGKASPSSPPPQSQTSQDPRSPAHTKDNDAIVTSSFKPQPSVEHSAVQKTTTEHPQSLSEGGAQSKVVLGKDQLIETDPLSTTTSHPVDDDSDDEPSFKGIQMVDNDPNIL